MNKLIYSSFKDELIKSAGASEAIGSGIGKAIKWSWNHPKTTIGVGVAAIAIPKITKHIFPSVILGSEYRKHGKISEQTELMKAILTEERISNAVPVATKPLYKKIERPLV